MSTGGSCGFREMVVPTLSTERDAEYACAVSRTRVRLSPWSFVFCDDLQLNPIHGHRDTLAVDSCRRWLFVGVHWQVRAGRAIRAVPALLLTQGDHAHLPTCARQGLFEGLVSAPGVLMKLPRQIRSGLGCLALVVLAQVSLGASAAPTKRDLAPDPFEREAAPPGAAASTFGTEQARPGFLERYRWPITGAGLFCGLQAALIVGLLVNRAQRRRGEAEATLVADISSKFVNLPPGEVDREIVEAERRVCDFLGLDFAVLWQVSDQTPGSFKVTHFYSVQAGPQPSEGMTEDQYPWSRPQLMAGRILKVSSPDDLPAEAARDRETLIQFGIRSNIALPLAVGGGQPFGILGLGTMRRERAWPGALVERLQVVAQIFANALARKRSDLVLTESELRLSLAADSADAGLWVLDLSTNLFWATDRSRSLFGYSPDEVVGMERFQATVHPDDWAGVRGAIDRSVQTGEPVNVEYRIRLGDGSERWIASRGRPYFKSSGEPERVLGLSMDITERKRAEEAFRASEARLAAGTELAGLGYYEVDYGARTCFLDDRFREICGVPVGAARGPRARWSSGWRMSIPTTANYLLESVRRLHEGKD